MVAAPRKLRIGTRGSQLAQIQTRLAVKSIQAVYPDIECEIIQIKTTGDLTQKDNKPLHSLGGKELFAYEINLQMLEGNVDIIVHSMKDLGARRDPRFTIAAVLERASPVDCFISRDPRVEKLSDLPEGAVIGTSGPRRAAISLNERPDLKIVSFRGNVPRRLQKLSEGYDGVDATYLARAGLDRLALAPDNCRTLTPQEMLPGAGQGAIGVDVLAQNEPLVELIRTIGCKTTYRSVMAEKTCLSVLNGDCKSAIGCYGVINKGELYLRCLALSMDGQHEIYDEIRGPAEDYYDLGIKLGQRIYETAGDRATDIYRFQV